MNHQEALSPMRQFFTSFRLLNVGESLTPFSERCMKSLVRFQKVLPIALISWSVLASSESYAGLIALLKGEKPNESVPVFQRVGFIGCAEVKELTGRVEVLDGVEKWRPLETGAHLSEGQIIRTQNGQAVLQMCDSASLVKVNTNTVVRLVPVNSESDQGVRSGSEERDGFVVRSLRGKAFFKDQSSQWKPVAVNDVLPEGTLVRAGDSSTLDLFSTREHRAVRIDSPEAVQLEPELALKSRGRDPSLAAAIAR
jgi:hypothetical protein